MFRVSRIASQRIGQSTRGFSTAVNGAKKQSNPWFFGFYGLTPFLGYYYYTVSQAEKEHLAHKEAHPVQKPKYPYMGISLHKKHWDHHPCSLLDLKCKARVEAGLSVE